MSSIYETYRSERAEAYGKLSFPVWKRLGGDGSPAMAIAPEGSMILSGDGQAALAAGPVEMLGDRAALEVSRRYGVSEKHTALSEAYSNCGLAASAKAGQHAGEPVHGIFTLDGVHPMALDHNVVAAEAGSRMTVVLDYQDKTGGGYHNGVAKLHVAAGARLDVFILQDLAADSTHIQSTVAVVEAGGEMRLASIDLGGGTVATDVTVYLEGDGASCAINGIYLGDGSRKLDLGYNIFHVGRHTESSILVKGALLDESRKVFRGNLKFEKGCKGAKGSEAEYAILLDERVKADAIPALLCDEDDVSGEHAASAGQVSSGQLFYLMSRGLSEREAKKLIIHASFAPVIDSLPDPALKERIEAVLERRLVHDLR